MKHNGYRDVDKILAANWFDIFNELNCCETCVYAEEKEHKTFCRKVKYVVCSIKNARDYCCKDFLRNTPLAKLARRLNEKKDVV